MNDKNLKMDEIAEFFDKIRSVALRKIIYTRHALDEMNSEEEMISKDEVRQVIFGGEIIENYPEDKRGHSCLIFGFSNKGRPVHVVCSPEEEYLWIITAYLPSKDKWEDDFKTRKKEDV